MDRQITKCREGKEALYTERNNLREQLEDANTKLKEANTKLQEANTKSKEANTKLDKCNIQNQARNETIAKYRKKNSTR